MSNDLKIHASVLRDVAGRFGTPCYLYDERTLRDSAAQALESPSAFGLSVRYAMKAAPNAAILNLFAGMGVLTDASSGYEARRALRAGIPARDIQMTTQEMPADFADLVRQGVRFNACSLHQLDAYGQAFPGGEISIRVNPGLGSGHTNRTNTGGPASSFGIWHELLPQVRDILTRHRLNLTNLHSHIGAGTDVKVWVRCADLTLDIARQLPSVKSVSLGGGFKVARMSTEVGTNVPETLGVIKTMFEAFAREDGRKLHLEIEPGTFLVANAGYVISRVVDRAETGAEGYRFLKVDTGMTEVLRPSLYGAQHPIWVLPEHERSDREGVLVVGHCCESGDILTPAPGDSEGLLPRDLPRAEVGDLLVIGGAGAYCSGMAAKNYNSFPEAPEVLLTTKGQLQLIRRRQTLEQVLENEVTG